MVQSFKNSLNKSSLPLRRALQEFLIQYRHTPLALGSSPSELLNGQEIHTKLEALLPSPTHITQGKQAAELTKAQQRKQNHPISRLVHTYKLEHFATLYIVARSEIGNHGGFQLLL